LTVDQAVQVIPSLNRLVWEKKPLRFFQDRFGVSRETIDWALLPEYKSHRWDGTPNPLVEIVTALQANQWVGVESGTGTGKTFLASLLTRWWLEVYPNSIVVTTAPKQKQLELHVWKELRLLQQVAPVGEMQTLMLKMRPPDDKSWIALGFVAGTRANEEVASRARGFHAEHMLIILEETPGIPMQTIRAFEATCTAPHNLILAMGNPDFTLDNLHQFCQLPRVKHIRISGYDYPNVVLNNPMFVRGAQTRIGLQRLAEVYGGEESPLYLSRARGICPTESLDALIRIQWCIEAQNRWSETEDELTGIPAIGVDVANSEHGDRAAVAFGRGTQLLRVDAFPCPNANDLGTRVWRMMKDYQVMSEYVGVDGVGVGAGTVNELIRLGAYVQNLIGGEKPFEDSSQVERFLNLRSQMWWKMRQDLQFGRIALPKDEELLADLTAPRFSEERDDKTIRVESKEAIRKRLGRSPDKGDAAVYWNWIRSADERGTSPEALREVKVQATEIMEITDRY
jgi:phage terminase large subunit